MADTSPSPLPSPVTPFDVDCGQEYRMDDPGGVMANVKVRTQYTGNCFAAAASALVDAYRAELGETLDPCNGSFASDVAEGPCNQTSDLWIAIAMGAQKRDPSLHLRNYARQACDAANAVLRDPEVGSCPRTAVPLSTSALAYGNDKAAPYFAIQEAFQELRTHRAERRHAIRAALALEDNSESRFEVRARFDRNLDERRARTAEDLIACLEQHGIPRVNIPSARIIEELFHSSNPIRMIHGILEPMCRPPTRRTDFPRGISCQDPVRRLGTLPHVETAGHLRTMLNQNHKRPVMITYCAQALLSRRGDTFDGVDQVTGKSTPSCKLHASLVIGQRRDPATNKCQFLVRNSWGPRCTAYMNGDWGGVQYCNPDRPGNIWVDARELSANIISAARLQ